LKSRILASLAIVITGGLFAAASLQPPAPAAKGMLPAISIQEVETDSAQTYALWIAESDKEIKAKFGFDNYIKVFVGEAAGPESGKTFAVASAESFVKLAENSQAFEKELSLMKVRAGMSEIRKLGPQTLLKAVRWDGRNPSSLNSNTRMTVTDEAGYLKALDGLRALLDAHNFKDIKINCYRVAAGRTDYTHMVSLNCPSVEQRAALMDAINTEPWALEWIASAAKYRTVVSNGTYREITR
jgi:hypothetical protein